MSASILNVQLFGLFRVTCEGEAIALPAAANARRLLAYLCVQRTPQARSALAGKLWPEAPEEKARQHLRQALWLINGCLPGLLNVDGEQVGFHPAAHLQVDCEAFERLAQPYLAGGGTWPEAARDLARAVELYQGDLLDGYYDDWAILARERLFDLYLQVLEKLIVAYKATLRYEQALLVALRLAKVNPLSESAQREAMRLYHYLGNPAEALKQYNVCQEYLQRELGIQPAPETRRLAQAIAQQGKDPAVNDKAPFLPARRNPPSQPILSNRSGNSIPLVGRNTERDELLRWLQVGPEHREQAGKGTLVLVEGEAGVGKTRLLQEAAAEASWRGAQVLWGKAAELQDGAPLGPLVEAIESALTPLRVEQLQGVMEPLWLLALQPLLPDLMTGLDDKAYSLPHLDGEHAHNRLLEALGRLFSAWAQISPLVIVLEDIHWGDEDTLEALSRLPGTLEDAPVTILASYRSEARHRLPRLADIRSSYLRGRLSVNSLSQEEASQLMHTALDGAVTPAFSQVLFQETRGNPLFILEFLRSLADSGALRQKTDGSWLSPYDSAGTDFELPLPSTVEQVILHRLEQLPALLLDILQALSVLGNTFDFKQASCLGLTETPGQLISALQELTKRRLLVETPLGYHFQHDKIQQSVYENIPAEHRVKLHGKIANALEANERSRMERPGQVEYLAHHFDAGQVWEKAFAYHRQAAEKAQTAFAYASATQHIQRALECAASLPIPWQEEFELRRRYNEALDVLGKRPEQGSNLEHMASLAREDAQRLSWTRMKQSEYLCAVNRFTEAEAAGRQAVELARQIQPPNPTQLAEALLTLADVLSWVYITQNSDIGGVLTEAARICEQTGSLALQAKLHNVAGGANFPLAPHTNRMEETQQALALYQQLGEKAYEADMACSLGGMLADQGADYEAAAFYDHLGLEIARSIGYRMLEGRVSNNLGNLEVTRDLNRGLAYFDQAATILKALNDERRASVALLNSANYRVLLLGDATGGQPAIEFAQEYAQRAGDTWIEGYALLLAGLAAQQQDLAQAHKLLLEALAIYEITKPAWLHTRTYMALAQVEQKMGCLESAVEHLEAAEAIARQAKYDHQVAFIQSQRAVICLQLGNAVRAEHDSQEAMRVWEANMNYAWEIPFARYRVLQAMGHHAEARSRLEQAYQALEKMFMQLTPEQRTLSCQRVPVHQAILQAWQEYQPQTVRVKLQPNRLAGEVIEVDWTISSPEDAQQGDKVSRRRYRLRRLLREAEEQGAEPTQQQLAQALGVSLRTISQDMATLQRRKGTKNRG